MKWKAIKTYKNRKKRFVLEKISKIDKTLSNLIKMRRENTQISKIRNEK
jgi:hypothetical protein